MTTIVSIAEEDAGESNIIPLTAEQAKALREQQPPTSPWRIVGLQAVVGLVAALLAWGLTANPSMGWSAGYGALVVVIPAVLFARGLTGQFASINAMTAGFGFFVWEAIKIGVSVGMLFLAPHLVAGLDWLAMLIGLVVTQKVYWAALLMRPERKSV